MSDSDFTITFTNLKNFVEKDVIPDSISSEVSQFLKCNYAWDAVNDFSEPLLIFYITRYYQDEYETSIFAVHAGKIREFLSDIQKFEESNRDGEAYYFVREEDAGMYDIENNPGNCLVCEYPTSVVDNAYVVFSNPLHFYGNSIEGVVDFEALGHSTEVIHKECVEDFSEMVEEALRNNKDNITRDLI